MSVFIPGNAETIIDFECVPTYSQTLTAQIINMDDNVIIPTTTLKSGTIVSHSQRQSQLPGCIFIVMNLYFTCKLYFINQRKKIIIP